MEEETRIEILEVLAGHQGDINQIPLWELSKEEWRELALWKHPKLTKKDRDLVDSLDALIYRLRSLRTTVAMEADLKKPGKRSFAMGFTTGLAMASIAAREVRDELLGIQSLGLDKIGHPGIDEEGN